MRCKVFWMMLTLLCLPLLALAQTQTGSIRGVVIDPSRQPVPGVTVTITSPALITRTETTVTGVTGAYQFIALPPGVYDVTFELEAFKRIEKKGVRVSIAVVSTLDATLDLAALEESVTVLGGAPVVDVQSNTVGTLFDKSSLDIIPTGRSPWAVAELVPGVQMGGFDVGGSQGMQNPSAEVHGSNPGQKMFAIDGVSVSWTQSPSGTMIYYDMNMFEEVSYQTNALSAEAEVGGIYMNMVTKSGGEEFHGQQLFAYEGSSFQWDNFDEDLRERGATSGNPIKVYYDINSTLGGRIVRNRLWFFSAYRQWRIDNYVSGVIKSDGTQAVDDNRIVNGMGKLTVQAARNHKVSYVYNANKKDRFHRRDFSTMGGGALQFIEDAATRHQDQFGFNTSAQWDWVASSRALMSIRFGVTSLNFPSNYQKEVGPTDISREDRGLQSLSVAGASQSLNLPTRYQGNASLSYWKDNLVGGSHDLKVGIQPSHNVTENRNSANGDIRQQYFNAVPFQVVAYNTPTIQVSVYNAIGVFAQDSYTRGNLTLNLGVRYDFLEGYNPAQTSPGGRFVGERQLSAVRNVPRWSTWVPRVGFSYALGRERRSSIKANYGRYYFLTGTYLPAAVSPTTLSYDRRSWVDRNGDDIAQDDELGPSTGFVGGANQRLAANLKRPYSDEVTIGFNMDIAGVFGIGVTYYRRGNRQQHGVKNAAATPDDYTPISVVNPLTGDLITAYNLAREKVGQVDRVVDNFDLLDSNYNGIEFSVTKRMSKRWQLAGGLTIGKHEGATAGSITSRDDLNNPNSNINRKGIIGNDATYIGKLSGIYQLPGSVVLSGALRYSTGYPQGRVLVVRGLNQVSESINVVPRGAERYENVAILDLSVSRSFPVWKGRLDLRMDAFNIGNSNAVFGAVETIGPRVGRPSKFLAPRILRLGAGWNF